MVANRMAGTINDYKRGAKPTYNWPGADEILARAIKARISIAFPIPRSVSLNFD